MSGRPVMSISPTVLAAQAVIGGLMWWALIRWLTPWL